MKLETRADGALIVSERMPLLRWGALLGATGLSVALVVAEFRPVGIAEQTFYAGALAALLAFAAAGFIPDREFEFDAAAGRLDWCVWRIVSARGGTIPFREIQAVVVKSEDDGESRERRPSYRLVLVTLAGHLPMTSRREYDRISCERVATAIRECIGLTSDESAARRAIAELARNGSIAEAIVLASRELGIGLAEARGYVESLKESKAA